MGTPDKKTNTTHAHGNSDESALEEREDSSGHEEVDSISDPSADTAAAEGAESTAPAEGESWGYEQKKRRFTREVAIAVATITALLLILGVVLWKSLWGTHKADEVAANNTGEETPPYVEPTTEAKPPTTQPEFTPQDIVNLPNYRVYLKLMIDGITSRPFSAQTLPPLLRTTDHAIHDEVVKSSRMLYCRPRDIEIGRAHV